MNPKPQILVRCRFNGATMHPNLRDGKIYEAKHLINSLYVLRDEDGHERYFIPDEHSAHLCVASSHGSHVCVGKFETVGDFYVTQIKVNVLSEGPFEFHSLEELAERMMTGDLVGEVLPEVTEPISRRRAAALCYHMGSEPGFFRMYDNGEPIDD